MGFSKFTFKIVKSFFFVTEKENRFSGNSLLCTLITDLRLGEKKFKVRRFFFVALSTLLYNLRLVKWAQNKAIIEFVLFWGFLQVRNSNNPISGFVLFAIRDFSSINQFHVIN